VALSSYANQCTWSGSPCAEDVCNRPLCEEARLIRDARHEREAYIKALFRERYGLQAKLPGAAVVRRSPVPSPCGCDRVLHRVCVDHQHGRLVRDITAVGAELQRLGVEA
jgi:hypothetical protein